MTQERLKLALSEGWRKANNRNRMMVFRSSKGSVQWYPNGSIVLSLQGPSNLGRAKSLFCRAFSWLSNSELAEMCDGSFREQGRHWIFEQDQDMPRFEITHFQRSHGLRIFSDGSHPTAIEIEKIVPLYLQEMIEVQNKLSGNIESHLELLKTWQKEAEERAAASRRSGEPMAVRFLRWLVTPLW